MANLQAQLSRGQRQAQPWLGAPLASLLAGLAGLALSRLLFEGFFPRLLWLGRPLPALLLAAAAGGLGLAAWAGLRRRVGGGGVAALSFLPLLLNALYLFHPAVEPARSRFLFGVSLWLAGLLAAGQWRPRPSWRWAGPLFALALLLPVYLLTLGQTVGRADTFEFQVVAPRLGIAHPTGYPLYLLLARLFVLLPLNSVAWRVNLATAALGLAALVVVYWLARRVGGRPPPAVLAAALLGLGPTFWSQAVEAEVYTLHALVVGAALLLMVRLTIGNVGREASGTAVMLAAGVGLGLTNHLTTVILLPGFGLALWFAWRDGRLPMRPGVAARLALALWLPLLLYVYLPLRWAAVNGEPMGLARFVEWVVGGRFQGALRWDAWLSDATRYAVVGRLLLAEWGWLNLAVAAGGLAAVARAQRRAALLLLATWLGFVFYALTYYVPDLAVFLLPAHLVTAVCWAAGAAAAGRRPARWLGQPAGPLVAALLAAPALVAAAGRWEAMDRSTADGLAGWGRAVLAQPLAQGAAILADSEKIAPLYYLQQAEGLRPDLDILVLPDETAYRTELDGRLAAGQTVYLARFLPGLEGVYHLRSAGPLTEVSRRPLAAPPAGATVTDLAFGPIRLLAYEVEPVAAVEPGAAAVSLYWQAEERPGEVWLVYLRWAGAAVAQSQHPANNYYPTVAWRPGEVVTDFHLLPRPVLPSAASLALEVALGPPFSRPEALAWQTLATAALPATEPEQVAGARPLRAQIGEMLLSGVVAPTQGRPEATVTTVLTGYGDGDAELELALWPAGESPAATGEAWPPLAADAAAFARQEAVRAGVGAGRFTLVAGRPGMAALCGWLARPAAGCSLAAITVSGVALPTGATNFADRIALLDITVPESALRPGGQLAVQLTWRALAPMSENYTVFVQVLDSNDRLVGQVDSWPRQGTYPTSQWRAGEVLRDPYLVQLDGDLPAGDYRLLVGWYLLATLQRLPVVDEGGAAVDDKVVRPGLIVE